MHSSVPLLCFPHAGGGRLYYAKWRRSFSPDIDFRVAQYPHREARLRDPMPTNVAALVEDIHDQFQEVLSGPYAIWGHSMGSLVGYELAVLAQRRHGVAPLGFFSSGSSAPCMSRFKGVEQLDTEEGFRGVLRRYGGIDERNLHDPDFMSVFASVIKDDLRMMAHYQDQAFAPLECPLVLMEGELDTVDISQWPRYAGGQLETHMFSGGHFFIDDHRDRLAALMESRVALWRQRVVAPAFGV